ncbi:hypothetical protein ACSER3_15085, partial [Pseudomonas aeruginosa]
MTSDVLPADAVASAAGNAHKPHLEQRPGRLTALVFWLFGKWCGFEELIKV